MPKTAGCIAQPAAFIYKYILDCFARIVPISACSFYGLQQAARVFRFNPIPAAL